MGPYTHMNPFLIVEARGFGTAEIATFKLNEYTSHKKICHGVIGQLSSARLERAACCLGGNRSIHLSYENIFSNLSLFP